MLQEILNNAKATLLYPWKCMLPVRENSQKSELRQKSNFIELHLAKFEISVWKHEKCSHRSRGRHHGWGHVPNQFLMQFDKFSSDSAT